MKIVLTPQESEEIFYNSLCNAVGTGWMSGYGLELTCAKAQYNAAKDNFIKESNSDPCYEDVLLQVLKDGGTLTFIDHESDGEKTHITLKEVHERVSEVPARNLINIDTENDDAIDADVVIQTVFFGEVVYG